jgi:hypothetical protein
MGNVEELEVASNAKPSLKSGQKVAPVHQHMKRMAATRRRRSCWQRPLRKVVSKMLAMLSITNKR